MAAATVALAAWAAAPTPASAFIFSLISDGSAQHLTWYWETAPPYFSCTGNATCGDYFSESGSIPLHSQGSTYTLVGGLLTTTQTSSSLKVVALPIGWAHRSTTDGTADAWASVDGRPDPMVFAIVREPGDPNPLFVDLLIRPRLVGLIEMFTSPGGVADLTLYLQMKVEVNGQVASQDAYNTTLEVSAGADSVWQASFPKGLGNGVVVPGVPSGSTVTITFWAYMRSTVSGFASIDSYGAYGNGPAIEIQIGSANAVAVDDASPPMGLGLAARPNPAPGRARIEYALPRGGPVKISVYDVAGHRVATLADRVEGPGRRELSWDAMGARGEPLAAGVYLIELVAGTERVTRRLVLLGH
jgi:flagellar hook capping protein FlgD